MFRVVSHEKACIVGNEVIADFEVFARGFDARLPSYAVDHQPCTKVLVPAFHKRLKRKPLEEAVDMGIF